MFRVPSLGSGRGRDTTGRSGILNPSTYSGPRSPDWIPKLEARGWQRSAGPGHPVGPEHPTRAQCRHPGPLAPALPHIYVLHPRDVQKAGGRVTVLFRTRTRMQQSKGGRLRKLARSRFQRALDTGSRKEGSTLKPQVTLDKVVKKIRRGIKSTWVRIQVLRISSHGKLEELSWWNLRVSVCKREATLCVHRSQHRNSPRQRGAQPGPESPP